MFWGLNLYPNRKYSQTVTKSFHISQAALDAETVKSTAPNQVFLSSENQKFLICTLRKDTCEQVMLDLNVAEGDEVCFQCVGSGHVTLSGYVIEEDNPYTLNEEEEEDSDVDEQIEEDLRNTLNKKAIKGIAEKGAKGKKSKSSNDEEEDDDEEDDDDDDSEDMNGTNEFDEDDDDDDDDDEDDEEEDEDDEEDDDDSEEEVQQPKAKQPKLDKSQKQQNGIAKEKNVEKKESKKENKKDNAQQQQQQQQQQKAATGERTLSGGVKVEDVRVGNGPEVKAGKRAQVYYEGRLKSNNKVFDSLKTGNGFKFNVGRGDVIKGWDVGVVGMKVGGKRRIVCPPHMAYGARGSPPTIPPNSTLVFEVELKGVN